MEDCRYIVNKMAEIFTWSAHGKERRSVPNSSTLSSHNDATKESRECESLKCASPDETESQEIDQKSEEATQSGLQAVNRLHDEVVHGKTNSDPAVTSRRDRQNCLCRTGDVETCAFCQEDSATASFVIRYFPLLDTGKIRKVLNWSSHCRWRTWLAYFVRNEDVADSETLPTAIRKEDWGKVSRILLELSSPDAFVAVAEELFDKRPNLVRDCLGSGLLHVWEVHFVCVLILDGHPYDMTLLPVLHRQTKQANYRDQQALVPLVKYSLEVAKVKDRATCTCGKAKLEGHRVDFQTRNDIGELVLKTIDRYKCNARFLRRVGRTCLEGGYWLGVLQLYGVSGRKQEVLAICQQLGDPAVLDDVVKAGFLSLSEEDWKSLIESQLITESSESVSDSHHTCETVCPNSVTKWTANNLLWCMLRSQGTTKSLDVLQQLPHAHTSAVSGFYFSCIKMKVIEEKKKKTVAKLRELVCNKTRSKGDIVMSAQLDASKSMELREALLSCDGDTLDPSVISFPESYGRFEPGEWGVGITLFGSTCQVCTLPLASQAGFSSAGIIIFKCGHCFHRKCVPEECCVTCFLSNFKSIIPTKKYEHIIDLLQARVSSNF